VGALRLLPVALFIRFLPLAVKPPALDLQPLDMLQFAIAPFFLAITSFYPNYSLIAYTPLQKQLI
jgi:hypothetical protein